MYDIVVVGGGPAGFSAAVNARARGAGCLIISADISSNPLAKSPKVDNYVGMCGMSGMDMLRKMKADAVACGAEYRNGHVLSVAPLGDRFMIAVGSDVVEAKRVILAVGVRSPKKLAGEDEHLGRGVSYCATCDGMLYRQKRAIVTGDADDLMHEAALLRRMGVDVTAVLPKRPADWQEEVPFVEAKPLAVEDGSPIVLKTSDGDISTDVVFILRNEQAMDQLAPSVEMNGKFIKVNERFETSIPGLYAAGDCVGRPLQVAKAVSDGLLAAWSATDSLA